MAGLMLPAVTARLRSQIGNNDLWMEDTYVTLLSWTDHYLVKFHIMAVWAQMLMVCPQWLMQPEDVEGISNSLGQ